MDELNLKGKKYISSKRAHEITGYTKDYVGQLARGGKIPAERVGRAWYIDEDALRAHASITHTDTFVSEPQIKKEDNPQTPSPSGEAISIPEQGEVLSLHHLRTSTKGNLLHTWGQVRYIEDRNDLLPALTVKTVLAPETSHRVKIHTPSIHQTTLHNSNTGGVKSVDGVMLTKKKPLTPKSTLPLRRAPAQAIQKKPNLSNGHYALIGSAAGVFVALVALFTGLYTPSEWSYTDLGGQLASSGEIEGSFFMIFDFFTPIFSEGIELIREFVVLLFGSLATFFNQGLEFILGYF